MRRFCFSALNNCGALLIDADTVYDPRQTNDRLLLGMKGTISEMEVASFRERAPAALAKGPARSAGAARPDRLPARYHAALCILKTPMYVGGYVYGRSRTETRLDAGQVIPATSASVTCILPELIEPA